MEPIEKLARGYTVGRILCRLCQARVTGLHAPWLASEDAARHLDASLREHGWEQSAHLCTECRRNADVVWDQRRWHQDNISLDYSPIADVLYIKTQPYRPVLVREGEVVDLLLQRDGIVEGVMIQHLLLRLRCRRWWWRAWFLVTRSLRRVPPWRPHTQRPL